MRMRVKYTNLRGIDALYNEEIEKIALFAAVGRFTGHRYQIIAADSGYKLIDNDYWTTNVYFCDTVIGAKALIEQLERYEEEDTDGYDWEQDETDYYWATR
jgi:hypothetical protein